jgi:uncharacterized protein
MPQSISTLIISVDKAGHVNQCLALAELMGWEVHEKILIPGPGRMDPLIKKWKKRIAMWRAQVLAKRKEFRGKTIIIASGAASEPIVAHARRELGNQLFAVFVGTPKRVTRLYDVAISSRHAIKTAPYALPSANTTAWISGILTRNLAVASDKAEQLGPVALIGGTNKSYALEPDHILQQLHEFGAKEKLRVVLSRRTPDALANRIRKAYPTSHATIIESHDRPGFLSAMQSATRFCVTPDSISMVCEALNTGRSIQIFDLPCFDSDTSTARFIAYALQSGWVSKVGTPSVRMPVDTGIAEAMESIQSSYEKWLMA